MNPSLASEAAAILVERRRNGIADDRLPESCRPYTLVDALDIQQAVSNYWCELMDDSIGGWKCLQPPQDKIVVGPIYTRTIDSVAPVLLWPKGDKARIEPELAFFFGVDLPSRPEPYTPADVDAAIVHTHMALELIHCRYHQPEACAFPEMLADGLVNQGLFIGPEVDNALAAVAGEFSIRVDANGEQNEYAGKHPNGNPRAPLYWLVEFLRKQGQGIVAGQAVITGSYAGVLEVPLDTDIRIHYAGLGEMSVSFLPRQSY
ncbi:hydratase [Cellvibrio japonicus]|uniref:Hydratase/decarboxylase family protein n=1 Tax=Cellvibrio japonicus (strain Ueda107) TaxID=498211 RepID=B3PG35_CELJU|nr:hydratase [Cellvibrio japonicus]ACE84142.1 hydratase/decarboxylase family protein [Cellvibrio japonicus Ueda107]QEI13715.1 hydratase [Cellvibrio japonicus]QEI17289.1 hydratase [Cellvibrio japonicus]QEI20866.1 hydratase [Cellvibrio japonicus]